MEKNFNLLLSAFVIVFVYLCVRGWCQAKTTDAGERLRHLIIHEEIEEDDKGDFGIVKTLRRADMIRCFMVTP